MPADSASTTIDHLFRHEAGRMVARLTRLFGPRHFDLAEEAVQDALCAALETWKFRGVPADPDAWLMRSARNRAIDLLRRQRRFTDIAGQIALDPIDEAEPPVPPALHDDRLALIFSCCHPQLGMEARLALILKSVCGFSLTEIAAAFFAGPVAIEKRVTRAKSYLKRSRSLFDLDDRHQVAARLDTVHQALYLLFSEGYHSLRADAPVRDELCHEAIRLAQFLATDPATQCPATDALLALMYFAAARLAARADEQRGFVLLAEQDRARWDRQLIALGFRYLDAASTGGDLTRFHLEAAIAAEHCRAARFADTDWQRILALYDVLATVAPSPIVSLNRAIAQGQREGPAAGLAALEDMADAPLARDYPFFHAAIGAFRLALGDRGGAATAFDRAEATARSPAERHSYARRREAIPS